MKKPTSTVERRHFIWKAGAAVSAAIASGAATATTPASSNEQLELYAIRDLHRAFAEALNEGRLQDVRDLFASGADGLPAHVRLLNRTQEAIIELAPDHRSAKARFACSVQAEAALESRWPLVEMARQQGQGVVQWQEDGVYETACVKQGGAWKIQHLAYRPTHEPMR